VPRPDVVDCRGCVGGFSTLQPRCQSGHVEWIEPDRSAEVDDHELSAFDESLDGARVHMEQLRCLLGRQQWVNRMLGADLLRQRATWSDRLLGCLLRSRHYGRPKPASAAIVLIGFDPGKRKLLHGDLARHRR
jgi:hypothetical protein